MLVKSLRSATLAPALLLSGSMASSAYSLDHPDQPDRALASSAKVNVKQGTRNRAPLINTSLSSWRPTESCDLHHSNPLERISLFGRGQRNDIRRRFRG